MAATPDELRARAAARRFAGGGLSRLEAVGVSTPPSVAASASERFANCWHLSVDAFLLSGREWPEYDRAELPGRMVRGRSSHL